MFSLYMHRKNLLCHMAAMFFNISNLVAYVPNNFRNVFTRFKSFLLSVAMAIRILNGMEIF